MAAAKRVNLGKAAPAAYKAMAAFAREVTTFAEGAGLEPLLAELIRIRVSQVNGCAFCLDMHHRSAIEAGEDPRRLVVLSAWRETSWFTPRERAALRLAESVTEVPDHQVPDDDYVAAAEALTEDEIAAVAWLAIAMNAFNRTVVAQWLNDQAARGGSSPDGGVAPALPAAWTPEADRLANAGSGARSRRGESRPDDVGSEACSSRDVSS